MQWETSHIVNIAFGFVTKVGTQVQHDNFVNVKNHSLEKHKCAFTLAEVLITLGIIGIVAAMTMPALIQKHRKQVIETRLKKFYTVMNQAVKFSEAQYGEFKDWNNTFTASNSDAMEQWYNKYFRPHVKTLKIDNANFSGTTGINVYLADGSKFYIFNYTELGSSGDVSRIHLYFYPYSNNKTDINGKDYFSFYLNASTNKKWAAVEPYKVGWNGNESELTNGFFGCRTGNANPNRHYCTALIQYNGWKIPDDYPYKF